MTNEYEDYEPYEHNRELSREELEAIATLSGVDADDLEAGYPCGDYEPWEREFAVLLWNLCRFYRVDVRRATLTEFADVDTRALFLCDVMHFLTGRQTPSLPAQVVASMAVRTVLDISKPGPRIESGAFNERWREVLDEAEAHFLAMMPRGAH